MWQRIKNWFRQRKLAKSPFTQEDWQAMARQLPVLDRLNPTELNSLIELATLFLADKSLTGAQGFIITDKVKMSIALQACLPILNLGLDWYAGWSSIIIYPRAFASERSRTDEFGIVHQGHDRRSGEAWLRGPVVLSWHDAQNAGDPDGHNVVIHEFVHKLDMMNGRANGFPPMRSTEDANQWTEVMTRGFEDFKRHPQPGLDRYAATNPAEFFAVLSEVFFEKPQALVDAYPDIYEIMVQFFRQSPLNISAN